MVLLAIREKPLLESLEAEEIKLVLEGVERKKQDGWRRGV